MDFSTDFYRDEVRCGFYVPTAIKQAWGAELTVLAEIDRICRKHNIKYYAEWGTLLGAIRHGGFIPWDDDMDIVMLRRIIPALKKPPPQSFQRSLSFMIMNQRIIIGCFCQGWLTEITFALRRSI